MITIRIPYFLVLLSFITLFPNCDNSSSINKEDKNLSSINGHWYLSNTINQEDIPYVELIIKDAIITSVNDHGLIWEDVRIKINSDSIFEIGSRILKIKSYSNEVLHLYFVNDSLKEFIFAKYDSTSTCNNSFYKNVTFRKLLYEIATVESNDTIKINELKESLWIEVGGVYDTLDMEEEILIPR